MSIYTIKSLWPQWWKQIIEWGQPEEASKRIQTFVTYMIWPYRNISTILKMLLLLTTVRTVYIYILYMTGWRHEKKKNATCNLLTTLLLTTLYIQIHIYISGKHFSHKIILTWHNTIPMPLQSTWRPKLNMQALIDIEQIWLSKHFL